MALVPAKTGSLVRHANETELMRPPTKRIKRPRNVIDEESYTDAISKIIARDFFPGLRETESQQEYLDALESQDGLWISSAGRKLEEVMTPSRPNGRRGTSIRRTFQASITPNGFAGDTPISTTVLAATMSNQDGIQGKIDTSINLDEFQSRYTSEDNESFYKLIDEQNEKRSKRYAWMWAGTNKLPSKMMLKQKETEARLLRSRSCLQSNDGEKSRLAIMDESGKRSRPDGWKSKPKNEFMFAPDSIEDSTETQAQKAQQLSRAPQKRVEYANTRMPLTASKEKLKAPTSPSSSAVRDAVAGKRRALDLESEVNGSETPRVNGYAFVDDEPVRATYMSTSAIDLGRGDAIKNPFIIRDQSKREDLHHRMVDRNARTKRATSNNRIKAGMETTAVPRYHSSPKVGPGQLTPAAQRLWSKMGKTSQSSGPSDAFGVRTPNTVKHKSRLRASSTLSTP